MSREARLQQLLNHPHVWKQGRRPAGRPEALPTGFTGLDTLLGGGWPAGAVTELLLEAQGIGELRALMPALRALQVSGVRGQQRRQLCWVNPPYIPYAPALARHGLSLAQLLVVKPGSVADAVWATEKALRSGACAAVLFWAERIDNKALRRLQLAAEATACWGVVVRSARHAGEMSPVPLRLCMAPADGGLNVEILRNRYGTAGRVLLPC